MIVLWDDLCVCCFKQKTANEMRISDWSSDLCSSDLVTDHRQSSRHLSGNHRSDDREDRGRHPAVVEIVEWQHRTEYPAPLDRRSLSGHQRPDPLGCRHDQGLCLSALADLQASACAWWMRPQGREGLDRKSVV